MYVSPAQYLRTGPGKASYLCDASNTSGARGRRKSLVILTNGVYNCKVMVSCSILV